MKAYKIMSSLRKRKQISDSSDNEEEEVIQPKQRCKRMKYSSNEVDIIKEFFKDVSKPILEICRKFLGHFSDISH